jgi:hypothetical protein
VMVFMNALRDQQPRTVCSKGWHTCRRCHHRRGQDNPAGRLSCNYFLV